MQDEPNQPVTDEEVVADEPQIPEPETEEQPEEQVETEQAEDAPHLYWQKITYLEITYNNITHILGKKRDVGHIKLTNINNCDRNILLLINHPHHLRNIQLAINYYSLLSFYHHVNIRQFSLLV
jgi:hypothetical protein